MRERRVTAPSGRVYTVQAPDHMSDEDILRHVSRQDPQGFGVPATPPTGKGDGFIDSFVGTAKGLASSAQTTFGALTGDATEAAREGVERQRSIGEEYTDMASFGRLADTFKEEGTLAGLGRLVRDTPSLVGQMTPTLITSGAGAAAGRVVGAGLGSIAGPGGTALGGLAGGAIGGVLGNMPFWPGSNLERQYSAQLDEGVESPEITPDDELKAYLYGAAQSTLEAGGAAVIVGRPLLGKIFGIDFAKKGSKEALLREARKATARKVGEGVARSAAVSLPVDIGQVILERDQAGLPIDNEEAFEEYLNTAYVSMGGQAPLAVSSSVHERRAARQELERRGIDPSTGEVAALTEEISAERKAQLEAEQRAASFMDATREQRGLVAEEAPVVDEAMEEMVDLGNAAMGVDSRTPDNRIDHLINRLRETRKKHLRSARIKEVQDPMLRPRDSFKSEEDFQQAVQEYQQFRDDAYALFAPIQGGLERLESIKRQRELETRLPEALQAQSSAEVFVRQQVREGSREEASALERALARKTNLTPLEAMQLTAAQEHSSILNQTKLDGVGLNRSTRAYNDLLGTDVATPEGRALVEQVIRDALVHPRYSDNVKESISRLYESEVIQELGLQDVLPLTPETVRTDVPLGDRALQALGLGPRTVLRREGHLQQQDPNTPEGRANITNMLEAFADSTRSTETAENIRQYLDRLHETPLQEPESPTRPEQTEQPEQLSLLEGPEEEGGIVPQEEGAEVTTSIRPDGVTEVHSDGISVRGRRGAEQRPALQYVEDGATIDVGHPTEGTRDPLYKDLGIPPNSKFYKDDALGGRDLSDPTDWSYVRNALENFLGRTKSKRAQEKIPEFIEAMDNMQVAEALRDDATGQLDLGFEAAENDSNPNLVGSAAYRAAQGAGDLAGSYDPTFLQEIRNGSVTGALRALVNNESDQFSAMESFVAQRFLDSELPMPRIRMVEQIDTPRPDGMEVHGRYDAITDTVLLKRGEADSHTFLHELMHAYTHRFLLNQQVEGYSDPNAKALLDLFAHTKRMLGDRAEDIYGLTNVSEFVAEAMSNPEFQLDLMGVPYKKKTVWSWFTDALKKLFGVAPDNPVDNVLFHALVHVDGLMNPGRQLQVDNRGVPVPNPAVDVVRATTTPIGELTPAELRDIARAPSQAHQSLMKVFMTNFQKSFAGTDRMTRFRTKMVDSMASVEEKLNRHFDGAVRDAMGNLNPIHFLRQGADHHRISSRVFRLGGLRRDPETGWEAYQLLDDQGQEVSPARAVSIIMQMGEESGLGFLGAKDRVATVMEGVRLAELREYNNQLEAIAVEHENKGTYEGRQLAFKYRDRKVRLHMTNAEIDSLVDAFERSPQIQEIQRVMNATRFNLIDQMVESGRLTEDAGEVYKSFIAYVPLDRVRDFLETSDLTRASRLQGVGVLGALPELKGSYERPVANTFDNYINTLGWMVGQVVRNDGSRRVLQALEDAGYAYAVSDQMPPKNESLLSPPVYIDGVPQRYQLESEFDLAAFAQADTPDGTFIRGMAAISRVLRATITAVPTFSLNMNLQDLPRAGMFAGTKSLPLARKILTKFPATVARNWRGTETKEGFDLHNLGVVGNYDYNPIDPLSLLEHELGARKHGIVGKTLNRLEQIAKASDQATREAIYQQTMLETGDRALAVMRAREYINYNRRGASRSVRVLTKTVPFFNAYAQGLDIMYRGVTGRGATSGLNTKQARRYVAGRFAMMTLLGLAYASMMQDDEDYKNAPEHVRMKGWMLPSELSRAIQGGEEDYTPLIFPAPRELAFIFKTIPEKVFQVLNENARGEDRGVWEAVKDLLSIGRDTYIMQPIPPGIKQAIEYATNYSFFTGRDLVSPHMRHMPTHMQVNRETSVIAEGLGKALNLSPIKLDNALKNTFGTMGAFTLRMSDRILREASPELPMDKIPGFSAFVAPEVGNRLVNEFYDLKNVVDTAAAGARNLQDDPERLASFIQENHQYLAIKKHMDKVSKHLTDLNKLRDALLRNPDLGLSAKERREEIKKLDQIRLQILEHIPQLRGRIVRDRR